MQSAGPSRQVAADHGFQGGVVVGREPEALHHPEQGRADLVMPGQLQGTVQGEVGGEPLGVVPGADGLRVGRLGVALERHGAAELEGGRLLRPDDLRAARLGLPPLPDDPREAHDQGDRKRGRQSGDGRVARAPAPGSLPGLGGPRQDRLPGQEPLQVVGQRPCGGVTPRGRLLQAFQTDGLRVAGQAGLEPRRRDRFLGADQFERLEQGRGAERRPTG